MPQIIKENITLIIALALPILLALFFMAARHVSEVNTEPPQYNFLVATGSGSVDFKIIDGQLISTFTYPEKNNRGHYNYRNAPDLYQVNVKTMIAEKVPLPLPANWRNPPGALEGNAVDMFLPGISDKEWSAAMISPDGYDFGRLERYDYNLMTEIFSGSHRRRGYGITKNGRIEKIRGLPESSYNLRLIAWEGNQ